MLRLFGLFAILILVGCAGFKLPFSDSDTRHARKMIRTSHDETNTDCIDFSTFREVGRSLEAAHILFLSGKGEDAVYPPLTRRQVVSALGKPCADRIKGLTTDEVRFQLFGGLQIIPNPERLQHLSGIFFPFEDTTTISGLRLTVHLEQLSRGPLRGVVAIYKLENDEVIHFVYSGADNVDRRTLDWPLLEFFGAVGDAGASVIVP